MHDCCICGCACYCHGDIDDCQVETEAYAYMHCEGCGCEEDRDYDEDHYCPGCCGEGCCDCDEGQENHVRFPLVTEQGNTAIIKGDPDMPDEAKQAIGKLFDVVAGMTPAQIEEIRDKRGG